MQSLESEHTPKHILQTKPHTHQHQFIPQISSLPEQQISEIKKMQLNLNFSLQDEKNINKQINNLQKEKEGTIKHHNEQEEEENINDVVENKQDNIMIYKNKNKFNQINENSTEIQDVNIQKQKKVKITSDYLERLTKEERFELALIALNKPVNQRNPNEQNLIEEQIDSFAYILKMKKLNPTLSYQIARVVKYQKCCKGQVVFYAGQQPEKFYLILRGRVAVLLKKSESQITTDLKNGKVLNLQNILNSNIQYNPLVEQNHSLDSAKHLDNVQESSHIPHSPNNLFNQMNNNSHSLQNNSNLYTNYNKNNNIFVNKQSVQAIQNISKGLQNNNLSVPNINQNKKNSIFSNHNSNPNYSQLFNKESISQSQNSIPQFNKDNQADNNSITPINQIKQRNNLTKIVVDFKQMDNISKHINMTPYELEEPERFYENGVFRYEFAKELDQGAAFGEMGLLLKVPRTATILALEDTHFVVMRKQNYEQIIKSLENYKFEKKMQFFHQILHFNLTIQEYGKLCADFSHKRKLIKIYFILF